MRRIRQASLRKWRVACLIGAATFLSAVTACTSGKTPNAGDTTTASAQKGGTDTHATVDIPCDIPSFLAESLSAEAFVGRLSVAKKKACIKEWNDYQRLMRRCFPQCTDEYGPHAYVMAADSLGIWTKKDDFISEKTVAEIATNGEYADLDLIQGLNELSLKYDPNKPDKKQWIGLMRPKDVTQAETLAVARFEGDSCCTSPDDFPAVARWDYNKNDNNQVIGVKCGDGWCEIGRKVKYEHDHPGGKKRSVKGWFDEQRLAVGTRGSLKPWSAGVATIFAVDSLESYTKKEDFESDWVHVATISSPQAYPKLGLVGTDRIQALMYLKHAAGGAWSARIVAIDGNSAVTTSEFPVTMIEHNDSIPGVARWGWDDTDETIWVRCANGCCQVQPPKQAPSQSDSTKVVPPKCPNGQQCGDTTRPRTKVDTARPKPK